LTTIVWDGNVLAADRLYSSEVAEKAYKAKIFSPKIDAIFEDSRLIAFGGSGNSMYLSTFEEMLLKQPNTSLEKVKKQLALDAEMAIGKTLYTSLLILTENACYKVWLDGKKPLHENVTDTCAAIGSGATFACTLLPEAGAFAALARAARCDKKTSYRINWASRDPEYGISLATYCMQIRGIAKDLFLLIRDKLQKKNNQIGGQTTFVWPHPQARARSNDA